jgi:hypothetical protein
MLHVTLMMYTTFKSCVLMPVKAIGGSKEPLVFAVPCSCDLVYLVLPVKRSSEAVIAVIQTAWSLERSDRESQASDSRLEFFGNFSQQASRFH